MLNKGIERCTTNVEEIYDEKKQNFQVANKSLDL